MLNTVISKLDIEKLSEEEKKKLFITCPHCRASYLPGEIYMPGTFIGRPVEVVKDSLGALIYVDYKKVENMPNNSEHYICDYCDKPFEIEATPVTYKTKKATPETDFSTEYVSLID